VYLHSQTQSEILMKNPPTGGVSSLRRHSPARQQPRGFALVISLSLMVLLTILAVGLLGLSSVSLATATRETDLAEARANARMSLALAIAQLQKETGPDQRVTVTADQLAAGADGNESAAGEGRRHWAGVYRSWGSTSTTRPSPEFLSWLVSGESREIEQLNTAKSSANSGADVEMVGSGTVGDSPGGFVRVPALTVDSLSGGKARFGWWTGDQGTKAALATPPAPVDTSLAAVRSSLQGAPRNAVELASSGKAGEPFAGLDAKDPRLALVTDWQQSAFLASDKESMGGLFHDLAPSSTGLLTNLRTGGFRKDLSMQLERPPSTANSSLVSSKTALYKAGGENGINLHELWAYYNLYKEVTTSGSHKFTTGGNVASGAPRLVVAEGPDACAADDEFFFKQPTIISYQMVLSLETREVNGQNLLHVVSDPIITFWNPLDIPVVLPVSSFYSIKYFAIPYDVIVTVGGATYQCPLIRSFTSGDSNFISLIAGNEVQQLVFKPGEVIKVSQSGDMIVRAGAQTDHRLQAKAGFNFGGGISYPMRDNNGQTISVPATASVRYEARANGFTAGQTGSSGLVPPGYSRHSRHFSISHHEVYVGFDREGPGPSMGFGGIGADWDFGNRRLKPGQVRAASEPGTKPSGDRMFANNNPNVYRAVPSSETRQLSAAELAGRKAPIMIISYNAKTEIGTDAAARTRYLGRFNPKAHHVDFYDLSQAERDMLPYEYTVDALNSWKNRSLETSTTGNAYYGGGMNAELGTTHVATHSVPREPLVSLAALQHSFANGFEILRPTDGYATLNNREPLLPQISHAIGNSVAPPMLAAGQTEGTLSGGRPVADHSYLANLNLWDDWFFSGITPQDRATYSKKRSQRDVAKEFFDGSAKLPVVRYMPDTGGQDIAKLLTSMFTGAVPTDAATQLAASLIRVDGLFNVNSTSVEAWKAVLGGLKGRDIVTRSPEGGESLKTSDATASPVSGLISPQDLIADSKNASLKDESQWVGRRVLDEEEIEKLAQAIVREVRRRGPFLSLSDFVNRRPGTDKNLARAGALQSALDAEETGLNSAWQGSGRSVGNDVAGRFAFPEAERGPAGYGMPGIIKQADILTPIAPVLTARSDSFIIRTYGESVDKNGKVLARVWCEAVVERSKEFVDASNKPETLLANLTPVNKAFGRRYEVVSFRWLHPEEV
jgi:Tfp pilus assembly protein PilV